MYMYMWCIDNMAKTWLVGAMYDVTVPFKTQFGGTSISSQWLTTTQLNSMGSGVFPIRSLIQSRTVLTYYPWPNICISPKFGTAIGGSPVRIIMVSTQMINDMLPFGCSFGNITVIASLKGNGTATYLECIAPPSGAGITVNATVSFRLFHIATGYILPSTLTQFYAYYTPSTSYLNDPLLYHGSRICTECGSFAPASLCWQDCAGQYLGPAIIDRCGLCSGGWTNHIYNSNVDCAGICYGKNQVTLTGQCGCVPNITSTSNGTCSQTGINTRSSVLTQRQYIMHITRHDDTIGDELPLSSVDTVEAQFGELDYPLARVQLSFTFPYFSQKFRRVWISGNGALLFTNGGLASTSINSTKSNSDALCAANGMRLFFGQAHLPNVTSLPSSSCGATLMIAASLTSLNPITTPSSSVRYIARNNQLIVRWYHVLLRVNDSLIDTTIPPVYYTFQVVLLPNGKITMTYWNISDPISVNPTLNWLVGLRAASMTFINGIASAPWNTPEIDGGSDNELQWLPLPIGWSIPTGYYPPRSFIQSRTSIQWCQIGNLCISPRMGPSTGGNIVTIHTLVTDWSCLSNFTFVCSFGGVNVTAILNVTLWGITCIAPPGVIGSVVNVTLIETSGNWYVAAMTPNITQYGYVSVTDPRWRTISSYHGMNRSCTDCGAMIPSSMCPQQIKDCAGVFGGSATRDMCMTCVGGNTTLTAGVRLDCDGNCYGPMLRDYSIPDATQSCYCITGFKCSLYTKTDGAPIPDTLSDVNIHRAVWIFVLMITGITIVVWPYASAWWIKRQRRHHQSPPRSVQPSHSSSSNSERSVPL
jgi:hypothetical protein